jgi:hypothetical protein
MLFRDRPIRFWRLDGKPIEILGRRCDDASINLTVLSPAPHELVAEASVIVARTAGVSGSHRTALRFRLATSGLTTIDEVKIPLAVYVQ